MAKAKPRKRAYDKAIVAMESMTEYHNGYSIQCYTYPEGVKNPGSLWSYWGDRKKNYPRGIEGATYVVCSQGYPIAYVKNGKNVFDSSGHPYGTESTVKRHLSIAKKYLNNEDHKKKMKEEEEEALASIKALLLGKEFDVETPEAEKRAELIQIPRGLAMDILASQSLVDEDLAQALEEALG